jgi:hypothetical protein
VALEELAVVAMELNPVTQEKMAQITLAVAVAAVITLQQEQVETEAQAL